MKQQITQMTMKEINDDELRFVARHYEEDALDAERALRTVRQRTGRGAARFSTFFRRIAASVGIMLIVGASLACGFWYVRRQATLLEGPEAPTSSVNAPYRFLQTKDESIVLKYDNAPIEDVLGELSTYYDRRIVLQSASASGRHISGEIEATSLEEVVEILEATLDVEIEIRNEN